MTDEATMTTMKLRDNGMEAWFGRVRAGVSQAAETGIFVAGIT